MVVLIDTNVILDCALRREPFYQPSKAVLERCVQADVTGYVAFHSIANLAYILRKQPADERREFLLEICRILTVTGASHAEVVHAIQNLAFLDLEDCLQERCAAEVHADCIITRNILDFSASEIPALSPEEFLSRAL